VSFGSAQLLEKICNLTRTQPGERLVRTSKLKASPTHAERLDRRPIDHAIRSRPVTPPLRPQPSKEGMEPNVDPDQAPLVGNAGDIQVRGSDHANAVTVNELVIEHVTSEKNLALPTFEVTQIQSRGCEQHAASIQRSDVFDWYESFTTTDPHQQASDRRIRLPVPPRDEVPELADSSATLNAHHAIKETRDREELFA
jgi:hypothetical protein